MDTGMKPYPTQPDLSDHLMHPGSGGHSHGHGHSSHGHGHSHGGGDHGHGHSHSGRIDTKEDGVTEPAPPGFEPSPRTCDIVKATQYGLIDRVKELIDDGFDVNQPDEENVTLLHWAAINNRLDIARYCTLTGL